MKDHPTRNELIAAANVGSNKFEAHLKTCDFCGTFYRLLIEYSFCGELPLIDAPQNWIEKAAALLGNTTVSKKLKSLAGKIIFDSWAMPLPAGVRSEKVLEERRVRFDISDKTFDLRGERRRNKWDFVARVTDSSGNSVPCKLVAGRKELTANEDGFYLWSSVRPPVKFKIQTGEGELETPELSWKKSRTE